MRVQVEKVSKMSFQTEKNINTFKYYLHGFIDGIVHIHIVYTFIILCTYSCISLSYILSILIIEYAI